MAKKLKSCTFKRKKVSQIRLFHTYLLFFKFFPWKVTNMVYGKAKECEALREGSSGTKDVPLK